jgi:hypothetical protein
LRIKTNTILSIFLPCRINDQCLDIINFVIFIIYIFGLILLYNLVFCQCYHHCIFYILSKYLNILLIILLAWVSFWWVFLGKISWWWGGVRFGIELVRSRNLIILWRLIDVYEKLGQDAKYFLYHSKNIW